MLGFRPRSRFALRLLALAGAVGMPLAARADATPIPMPTSAQYTDAITSLFAAVAPVFVIAMIAGFTFMAAKHGPMQLKKSVKNWLNG